MDTDEHGWRIEYLIPIPRIGADYRKEFSNLCKFVKFVSAHPCLSVFIRGKILWMRLCSAVIEFRPAVFNSNEFSTV